MRQTKNMNYAVQFEHIQNQYLAVSARKRSLKHSLITVRKGMLSVRLGRNEYVTEAGGHFWLPVDCLASLTVLPGTTYSKLDFSVRLTDTFPLQAGYVTLAAIAENSLALLESNTISDEYRQILFRLMRFEISNLSPELKLTPISQQVSRWTPQDRGSLSADIHLSLKLREARKRLLSGENHTKVSQQLFGVNSEQLERLFEHHFGIKTAPE